MSATTILSSSLREKFRKVKDPISAYWKQGLGEPFKPEEFNYESTTPGIQLDMYKGSVDLLDFYRQNPVVACKELLGIHLVYTQRMMLNVMWFYPNVVEVLSRGMSKTFMLAIYIMLRLLLYSDITIAVISKTFRQAQEVFTFIRKINQWALRDSDEHGPLRFFKTQLLRMRADQYMTEIEMKHGSKAFAVPVGREGDGGRGKRAHILIVDEACVVPQKVVEVVANAYLNVLPVNPLQWGKDGAEMNQRIYCSSASPQWHWFWKMTTDYAEQMYKQDQLYRLLMLDFRHFESDPRSNYRLDWQAIKEAKSKMGKLEFKMEYMNWFVSGSHSFFDLSKLYEIKKGDPEVSIELKGTDGAMYMIVADPAETAEGDAFALGVVKIFPELKSFAFVYLKRWNDGISMQDASVFIRGLQYLFGAQFIITDSKGGGAELIKQLTKDEVLSNHLGPGNFRPLCMHDEHRGDALPIVWPVKFSSQFNEIMGWDLKHAIEQSRLKVPPSAIHHVDPRIKEISILIQNMIHEITEVRITKSGSNLGFKAKKGKKDFFTIAMLASHYTARFFAEELVIKKWKPKTRAVGISYSGDKRMAII